MPTLTRQRAIARLQKFISKIQALREMNREAIAFKVWTRDVEATLKDIFGEQSPFAKDFTDINYFRESSSTTVGQDFLAGLKDAEAFLHAMVEKIEDDWEDDGPGKPSDDESKTVNKGDEDAGGLRQGDKETCVFIGHGRNPLWAQLKLFLENDLKLATVTYESESRVGESIVPVLEKMLEQATFAILILTAEDETPSGVKRARQNVIHEAGLFQGKLGFKKAILLRQEGTEEFSNVAGLQYISFGEGGIEQIFWRLQQVLKREGQIK